MKKRIWILGIMALLLLLTGCGTSEQKKPAGLKVEGKELSDISFLAGRTDLEMLDLSGTKVKDLSVLSELTNLRVLVFSESRLDHGAKVSLAPLANLTNLEVLDLNWTDDITFEDFDALGNLMNLKELHLNLSGITDEDLAFLSKLKNLEVLDLGSNSATLKGNDLSFLSELTSLRVLSLCDIGNDFYNEITTLNLQPLTRLTNLECLLLGSTKSPNLSPLVKMTNLRGLDVGYLEGGSLGHGNYDEVSLRKMTFLEYLNVGQPWVVGEDWHALKNSLSPYLKETEIFDSQTYGDRLNGDRGPVAKNFYTPYSLNEVYTFDISVITVE